MRKRQGAIRLLGAATCLWSWGIFAASTSAQAIDAKPSSNLERQPDSVENRAESPSATPIGTEWRELFDGQQLHGWRSSKFGGDGTIEIKKGAIVLGMGAPLTGITWIDRSQLPRVNYELSLQTRRVDGHDFFCGLTFPYLDSHATLILGGWGGSLIGISSLNGQDASENETMRQIRFRQKHWYSVRLLIRRDLIQVWLDQEPIVTCRVDDRVVNTRMEVDLSKPLGIASYDTRSEVRAIRIRRLPE